jgi:hypothetical protein
VRWPPACEDLSQRAEEIPLLADVTKQSSENRVILICEVQSRLVQKFNKSDFQSKPRL